MEFGIDPKATAGRDDGPLTRVLQCGRVDQRLAAGDRGVHGGQVFRGIGIKRRLAGRIDIHVLNVGGQIAGGRDRVSHLMPSWICMSDRGRSYHRGNRDHRPRH
ncbi:hypothetical protein A3649_08015 [Mycobacterium ulcerans]|nr:hypothetical protein A3649_08015 [Mycobacterium ulcerans]